MGLDQCLYRKIYTGFAKELEIEGIDCDPKKVRYITEEAMYWRKANQIHKWFVDNVQDGKDDCGEYSVPVEKLIELRDVVAKVLKNRKLARQLLPPQEGFFFGTYDYDEWYWKKLEETMEGLNKILRGVTLDTLAEKSPSGEYTYRSSW